MPIAARHESSLSLTSMCFVTDTISAKSKIVSVKNDEWRHTQDRFDDILTNLQGYNTENHNCKDIMTSFVRQLNHDKLAVTQ